MESVLSSTGSAWLGRISIALLLLLLGVLYGRGWSRLQTDQSDQQAPQRWQIITFITGLSLAGLTLISAFATLATTYYSVRELQHILITGLVPFFLLISEPYVVLSAALPPTAQATLRRWGKPNNRVNRVLRMTTSPGLVWGTFVSLFWLWHDPAFIDASRNFAWVHTLEIGSLVTVSLLYWWHIADARPKLRRPMPPLVRILYVFIGMFPIKLLGLFLLFGNEAMSGSSITSDSTMITVGNITIADRSLGALLLWLVGGFTYTYTAIFLAGREMGKEEDKPPFPVSILEQDETWRAPAIHR